MQFNGYGATQVADGALVLAPAGAVADNETHSALVVSDQVFGDLDLAAVVETRAQLRPTPNPWEVAWLLWHYQDTGRFYYLTLKPNGWELGKEDPAYPGWQRFLATGDDPTFPIGVPREIAVSQRGGTIDVAVDGSPLVSLTDAESPYLSGAVGLYAEDSVGVFDRVAATAP